MTATRSGTGSAVDGTKELRDTLHQVFTDHAPEHATDVVEEWAAGLWSTLDQLGVTRLTLPEAAGGSGGELTDSAALLLVAGEAAAPVPLAETDLLASWLLHVSGLSVPATAPLAVACAEPGQLLVASPEGDGSLVVTGNLPRVGWARHAARIAVVVGRSDGPELVLSIDPREEGVTVRKGANIAGEPRDAVDLVAAPVREFATVVERPGEPPLWVLLARRAALARALLLAGAAAGALNQSVRYAAERTQFGRPIAQFQAVQQQLARAAAEVAAARAAVDAAVSVAASAGFAGAAAEFAVAAAKARTGEAAGEVARIAHQVHGAIGFTLEHPLRRVTTRLWAWRDEDGDEALCNAQIARSALAAGADGVWALLAT